MIVVTSLIENTELI